MIGNFMNVFDVMAVKVLHGGSILNNGLDVEGLLSATPEPGTPTTKVDDMIKNYGAGGMSLMQNLFVYILGICVIIVAALMVMHGRNRQKMADIKDGLGWQIAGGILGFSAIGFVVFMQTIGQGIFK